MAYWNTPLFFTAPRLHSSATGLSGLSARNRIFS
uniref:Uncharacterized protein n=1 Tax=Anguilla anguilla TaxID=7936 RepID=A0A0E9PPE9_ANGAN